MYDITEITDQIITKLGSNCEFKPRNETKCFVKTIVTELVTAIRENSEVFLKSGLEDGILIIKDGEITTADRETPIIGLNSSEVGLK